MGVVFVIVLLAACATGTWETINVPINPKGWKMGYSKKAAGQGWIKEYVRPPETVNNWTQLATLQFLDNVFTPPKIFMNHLESRLREQCPDVEWHTIDSDKTKVLYEWKISHCPGHRDQHELSLLLLGDYGLYRAAYTKRGSPMDPAVRKQWIQWLSAAKIIKIDR